MKARDYITSRVFMFLPLVLITYFYVSVSPLFLYHHDIGWHLSAGDFIRANGRIPERTIYAFTAGNQPWYDLSWLWDVGASLLYQHGGFDALVLCTILIGITLSALLLWTCLALGASASAAGIAAFAASCLLPFYTRPPNLFLCVAPGAATLVCLGLFYLLCIQNRHLWLMPLCMLLWVNIHGGFPAGFITIGAFIIQAFIARDRARGLWLVGIGVSCAVATLATPLGIHVYRGILQTLYNASNDYISEWQPFLTQLYWPMSYLALAYIAVFVIWDVRWPRSNPFAVRLLSWLWLLMGLLKLRYLSLFFVFSAPHLAVHVTRVRWPNMFRDRQAMKACGLGIALSVLAAIPPTYYLRFYHQYGLPKAYYPEKEIAYLKERLPDCILLNNWNYGGFLIFAARGSPSVFIDGRAGTAYPDEVIMDYGILLQRSPADWQALLEKYGIDTVLWPRSDDKTSAFFRQQPGWTVAYPGDVANVYTKRDVGVGR